MLNWCFQAVSNDLDTCKEQLVTATAAADTANNKHAGAEAAARRAAAKQQQRLAAAGHAITAVASLLLACLAAMTAAATALQQHMRDNAAAAAAGTASGQQAATVDVRGSMDSTAAAAAASAMVASGLADMVCLSREELTDLLGEEDETCKLLGLTNSSAKNSTDSVQSDGSSDKQRLLLEGDCAGWSEQQQELQKQLSEAVEQLMNGEAGASSSSTGRSSVDGSLQVGQQLQQNYGNLKGLLLHAVVNNLSDQVAVRQDELRAATAAVVCA